MPDEVVTPIVETTDVITDVKVEDKPITFKNQAEFDSFMSKTIFAHDKKKAPEIDKVIEKKVMEKTGDKDGLLAATQAELAIERQERAKDKFQIEMHKYLAENNALEFSSVLTDLNLADMDSLTAVVTKMKELVSKQKDVEVQKQMGTKKDIPTNKRSKDAPPSHNTGWKFTDY
jgi:hypothetical protein